LPASRAWKLITVPQQFTKNRPTDTTEMLRRTDACGHLRCHGHAFSSTTHAQIGPGVCR
jgi:hypothetical protein